MNIKRFISFSSLVAVMAFCASAQSYYDDDIYFDASKASKNNQQVKNQNTNKTSASTVSDYPAADSYAYSFNGTRNVNVDDYNRRGIFAQDSLTADTTATDFEYTRRIEQFYNPDIINAIGDQDLANIYYMNPQEVNIYVNTPSSYWGYDYFYPYSWGYGSWGPYWSYNPWRWGSSWYWNSWYDPYWSWGWGPSWGWGWGPSWSWGPSWGWGPGPSWGWTQPYNPRHPGVTGSRPSNPGVQPGTGSRPGITNGGRHQTATNNPFGGNINNNSRPSVGTNRPGNYTPSGTPTTTVRTRPGLANSNTSTSTNRTNNSSTNIYNNTNRNTNTTTNGGRYNSGSFNSGSRSSGSFGGGRSGGSSGGRSSSGGSGRH